MSRFQFKWALALVIGGLGWGLSSGRAVAQYPFGGFRPIVNPFMGNPFVGNPWGSPWGNPYMGTTGTYSFVNPYTGGAFSYQYPAYPISYGYSFYNPFLGRVMNYQVNALAPGYPNYGSDYGYARYGYGALPYIAPAAYSGSATVGSGAYSSSANPVINEQLRLLRGASYQAGYTTPAAGNTEPKAALNPPRKAPANAGNPVPLEPALLTARDADVLTGKALNELAVAIRGLEAKGSKAESSLLPPELLTKIAYQGGPAGEVLSTSLTGTVSFPWPLTRKDFAQVRADLEQPANAVLEPLAAGKKVDAAAADKLTAAATKAKTTVAPQLKGVPADDAANVNRFLDRLTSVAKAAKDPAVTGVVVPKWSTVGASVADVLKHQERFKLTFAPAPTGSEEAYFALYRGLAGYYTTLAQGKP